MNGLPINYWQFCFALFLSIRLSLSVTFCSYKIIFIFSMSNENIIIDTKINPIHPLHVSKQTKLIIDSKQIINQMSKHI